MKRTNILSLLFGALLVRFSVTDEEAGAAASGEVNNNPITEETKVPTTDTRVSDVPAVPGAAGGASAAETSSPVASALDASNSAEGKAHAKEAALGEGSAALGADGVSVSALQSPAANASLADGESLKGENSGAELTFEQRVEERFLALEHYLMKLPHSIAHAFSQGSAEPEELANRAIAHLFGKHQ